MPAFYNAQLFCSIVLWCDFCIFLGDDTQWSLAHWNFIQRVTQAYRILGFRGTKYKIKVVMTNLYQVPVSEYCVQAPWFKDDTQTLERIQNKDSCGNLWACNRYWLWTSRLRWRKILRKGKGSEGKGSVNINSKDKAVFKFNNSHCSVWISSCLLH